MNWCVQTMLQADNIAYSMSAVRGMNDIVEKVDEVDKETCHTVVLFNCGASEDLLGTCPLCGNSPADMQHAYRPANRLSVRTLHRNLDHGGRALGCDPCGHICHARVLRRARIRNGGHANRHAETRKCLISKRTSVTASFLLFRSPKTGPEL